MMITNVITAKTMKFVIVGVLFNLSLCLSMSTGRSRGLRATDPCTETQRMYQLIGFNNSAPSEVITGENLQICPNEYTCCTKEMEEKLHSQSVLDFENTVEEKSSDIKTMFTQKHNKFDRFFEELVENSSVSLDDLFYRTYGELYSDNSAVFMDLFRELKSYYRGDPIDISDVFDSFFTLVMQKVFELINPSFTFDEDYMQCIADNINMIQPFKDMPEKISSQVQRAFVTARSFVQGLEVGQMLARKVAKFYPTSECAKALTKMSYCSKCQGYTSTKPCHNLCINVMKGCLCDYNKLNQVWNEYIDAMHLVLHRLEGPFNIESVLDPIGVKISEAIMHMQRNKKEITKAVFRLCGRPVENPNASSNVFDGMDPGFSFIDDFGDSLTNLPDISYSNHQIYADYYSDDDSDGYDLSTSRRTRSADTEADSESHPRKRKRSEERGRKHRQGRHLERSRKNKKTKKISIAEEHRLMLRYSPDSMIYDYDEERDSVSSHASLELGSLVEAMRESVNQARNHWMKLPYYVCKDVADTENSATCWNGETEGTYHTPVVDDGMKNQYGNPEISISIDHTTHDVIRVQISEMKKTIGDLKIAFQGLDPQLGDDDNEIFDYSGEGSSEGSGVDEMPVPQGNDKDSQSSEDGGGGSSAVTYSSVTLLSSLMLTILFKMQ